MSSQGFFFDFLPREDVSDSFSASSSSDSDTSSDSDSDSGKENDASKKKLAERRIVDEDDEDDEEGGAVAATVSLRTKNELPEPDIVVPSITEVGPDEQLEKVGEIMNIVNNVVIVKGAASSTHRASEHALDSETLLVYEDRKVLGYVSGALPSTLADSPTYSHRYTKRSGRRTNPCIKSSLIAHIPWT